MYKGRMHKRVICCLVVLVFASVGSVTFAKPRNQKGKRKVQIEVISTKDGYWLRYTPGFTGKLVAESHSYSQTMFIFAGGKKLILTCATAKRNCPIIPPNETLTATEQDGKFIFLSTPIPLRSDDERAEYMTSRFRIEAGTW
jgi:hypothetical protein